MFVVLVTDFAAVQEVYGLFDSREAARAWAAGNLQDVYCVFEMKPAGDANRTPAPTKGQVPN